jgi:hypothetical protein
MRTDMKKIISVLVLAIVSGCSNHDSEGLLTDDKFLDINNDGINDIRYEFTDNGYYELTDSNFDGKVDASSFYDSDGRILNSQIDQDYDGILESETLYENGTATKSFTDINLDGKLDILFVYDVGVLVCAEKYYVNDDGIFVGHFKFNFDYPESREKIMTVNKEELLESRKVVLLNACGIGG